MGEPKERRDSSLESSEDKDKKKKRKKKERSTSTSESDQDRKKKKKKRKNKNKDRSSESGSSSEDEEGKKKRKSEIKKRSGSVMSGLDEDMIRLLSDVKTKKKRGGGGEEMLVDLMAKMSESYNKVKGENVELNNRCLVLENQNKMLKQQLAAGQEKKGKDH